MPRARKSTSVFCERIHLDSFVFYDVQHNRASRPVPIRLNRFETSPHPSIFFCRIKLISHSSLEWFEITPLDVSAVIASEPALSRRFLYQAKGSREIDSGFCNRKTVCAVNHLTIQHHGITGRIVKSTRFCVDNGNGRPALDQR